MVNIITEYRGNAHACDDNAFLGVLGGSSAGHQGGGCIEELVGERGRVSGGERAGMNSRESDESGNCFEMQR